jgi:hypothetical protein
MTVPAKLFRVCTFHSGVVWLMTGKLAIHSTIHALEHYNLPQLRSIQYNT